MLHKYDLFITVIYYVILIYLHCANLFIYLLCHIYPGVPHQCAALFSLGLLHYMHDKTNINQHTFSYNTVTTLTTWYIHHYMHNVNYVYMFLITVVTCRCRFMFGQHYVQCTTLHHKFLKCSLVSRLKYLYSLIDFKCTGKLLKSLLPVYPNDLWPCTVLNAGIFTLPEVDVRVLCL